MVPRNYNLASSFIIDRCGTPCFRFNRRLCPGGGGASGILWGHTACRPPDPVRLSAGRDNAAKDGRIARELRHRGPDVRVWDLSAAPPATIEAQIEGYRPALLH